MKAYKLLAVCLTAALCALCAGCGGNDSGKPASVQPSAADSAVSETVSEATDESKDESSSAESDTSVPVIFESDILDNSTIKFELDDARPYDNLDAYLQSDAAKRMISKISGPDPQGIITTKVFAEKGCLVFERRFSKDFNLWLKDDFIENVKKSVEEKRNVFISLVDQLESCINKKTIKVNVRYVDPEGSVLYERVFDNDKPDEASKTVSQSSKKA